MMPSVLTADYVVMANGTVLMTILTNVIAVSEFDILHALLYFCFQTSDITMTKVGIRLFKILFVAFNRKGKCTL